MRTNPNDLQARLTKREYFAAMALQGLIAEGETFPSGSDPFEILSSAAVRYADALIAALNENADGIDEDYERMMAEIGNSKQEK